MTSPTAVPSWLKIPEFVYEGVDPNLEETYTCFSLGCGEREGDERPTNDDQNSLQKCSRCRLARYCSRECQKEDYAGHKEDCKTISKLQKRLKVLAAALRSCQPLLGKKRAYVRDI